MNSHGLPTSARISGRFACSLAAAALLSALPSCGSVPVPEEHYYRLRLPEESRRSARPQLASVRVEALALSAGLSRDRLLVAKKDPLHLHAYEFHRWVGPLELMVQDALRTGLARSGRFEEVKGPSDEAGEQLTLSGRILDFHQMARDGRWWVAVTLEMRAFCPPLRRTVFQEEFRATVQLDDGAPLTAVTGLSKGMEEVVREVVARCVDWSATPAGLKAKPAK